LVILSQSLTDIFIASFEGYLRIYKPTTGQFTINDMLLEKNIGLPILAID